MKSSEGSVGAGVAISAAGGALALVAFLQPQGLRAPPWVVYAAALAFVFAGWLVVARASKHEALKAWLPVPLLACLVAPPLWIGFGSGYRRCSIAALGGAIRLLGVRSDLPCRVAFGIAAALGVVLLLIAIRQAARSGRDGPG